MKSRRTTSTLLATGLLLAGAQDLNSEEDLDFTSSRVQRRLQVPVSRRPNRFPFCILDLETTGFSPQRDAILEIAVLAVDWVDDLLVKRKYEFYVRPPRNIPAKITELTGITQEMVADADGIDKVIPKVKSIVKGLPIVAHNASFDRRMLESKAQLLSVSFGSNEWICSMQLAERAWPGRGTYKLASFAEEYRMPAQNHRALADCELTLEVYLRAYDQLQGDFSLKPLPESISTATPQEEVQSYDADLSNDVFVFSGFRNDVLAARIENCGGTIKSSISRRVTILLVESKDSSTGKVKKALEYGIKIQLRKDFCDGFYYVDT